MNYEEYQELAKEIPLHYLIIFPVGDRSRITVIDNQFSYEMAEYALVYDEKFSDLEEVLELAKRICTETGLRYERFESRYSRYKEKDPLMEIIAKLRY